MLRRVLKRLLQLLIALLLAGGAVFLATSHGGATLGALRPDGKNVRASPEWKGDHFENPTVTGLMKSDARWEAMKEWLFGTQERVPEAPLPLFPNTLQVLATAPETGLRLTWFGHSSTLIEIDGVRVLTDPQWSERASPSSLVGPKRFHPPVVPLASLRPIDAVVISHDHYDHLDMESIQLLASMRVRFIVPVGIGAHLRRWGVPEAQIVELDWWQEVPLTHGVRLVSVPARHFSGRFVFGNDTLWSSWALVGPKHRAFFSGDTGLHDGLQEIAQKLGPFDVALVEIGQYHPSWGDIHLGPEGAVKATEALHARQLLPIHWGTFNLAFHGWSEPAEELIQAAGPRGLPVLTPLLGEPIEPARWTPRAPWWRQFPSSGARK